MGEIECGWLFHARDTVRWSGYDFTRWSGEIIFSCRKLQSCLSPLDTELMACIEGCTLALQWSTNPFIVEMDCLEAVGND
jgi:hypothetical protein